MMIKCLGIFKYFTKHGRLRKPGIINLLVRGLHIWSNNRIWNILILSTGGRWTRIAGQHLPYLPSEGTVVHFHWLKWRRFKAPLSRARQFTRLSLGQPMRWGSKFPFVKCFYVAGKGSEVNTQVWDFIVYKTVVMCQHDTVSQRALVSFLISTVSFF